MLRSLFLLLLLLPASAATVTWDGGGGDNLWQTGANWVGDVAPVAGDALVFAGTVQPSSNNNFAANTSFVSITFSNTTTVPFTLAGNRITLTGGITVTAVNGITHTISLDIIINSAAMTISVGANKGLTLSGVISETGGSRGITKDSLIGTLTLSGTANTFSGIFNAGSGQTNAASIASVGAGASSLGAPTTVANGTIVLGVNTTCTLNINGVGPFTSDRNFTNNTTGGTQANIRSNQTGGTLTLSGNISNAGSATARGFALGGTGDLIVSGIISNGSAVLNVVKGFAGTTTLSGVNTYTGTTAINVGTLNLTGTLNAGSAVTVQTSGTLSGTGTANGSLTVNSGGTICPGISTAVATLTIGGTATFAAGSASVMRVGTLSRDVLAVTGAVTLNGTLTVVSITPADAVGTNYLIVTGSSVTGTYTGKPDSSVFVGGGKAFRVTYQAASVTLGSLAPASNGFFGGFP